ncbi:MAG: 16S rRNA (uracil(1498)-N(3))-methyltransferase, partial [Gammaproteobacteria bacterium]|nr:16S rRNA (uracil(1498)-N(3))-methyltransferase [Gammaproteobacteria bacterium]
ALTRLYVSDQLQPGKELQLREEQARYVGRALRLRAGNALTIFNGKDGEFEAIVATISKFSVTVEIGERRDSAAESPLKVHLVQGISRGDRMDFIVQKATELGVKRISPVLTEYGVIKLDATRAGKRRDHWRKVAESACEQSGRIRPPLIDVPMPLNAWFGNKTEDADIDLILQPGVATTLTSLAAPKTKVCILIGPEGGFSPAELENAVIAGFAGVSLGPRILRTETAALAALAIVQSLWGDLRLD